MKITMRGMPFVPEKYVGWHVITPNGELAFAADCDNPFSMTMLPVWLAQDHGYARTPQALAEFRRHLAAFVEANRKTIRSPRVVINLREAPSPLPFEYVKAVQEVFRDSATDKLVDHVVIYASLMQ
jgi:hypothetical protein